MKNTPYQQAVALEYGKNKTPVVSAKGEGELARRIAESFVALEKLITN